jgi:hypothetical protein
MVGSYVKSCFVDSLVDGMYVESRNRDLTAVGQQARLYEEGWRWQRMSDGHRWARWLKKLFGLNISHTKRTGAHNPATEGRNGGIPSTLEELLDWERRRQQSIEAGSVEGKHYVEYAERVRQLKRERRHSEAITLLLKLIDATEAEAKVMGPGHGVAPWYYEQLAIVYRKEKRYADEVAVLERYQAQPKAPGVGPQKLAARLHKARKLADLRG